MPPRGSVKVRSSKSTMIAVRLLQAARLDDDVAEARTGRNVDFDRVDLLRGVFGEQLFVGVQARLALGLARARRHADPVELALQRPLPLALGLLFELQARSASARASRCSCPRTGMPLAAIELEDPAGDVVEEVAIVRDRDDGAGIVLQEPLEPRDRFGVEVVGRLVEQQQIGRLQQQPAQRHAAALAARQRR